MSKLEQFLDDKFYIDSIIAKCFRGNPYSGRLWLVRESFDGHKFIVLITYKKEKCKLKQKNIYTERNMNFKYVDCPLKYLDMAQCPQVKCAAKWREKVYEYHNNRIIKREANKLKKAAEKAYAPYKTVYVLKW